MGGGCESAIIHDPEGEGRDTSAPEASRYPANRRHQLAGARLIYVGSAEAWPVSRDYRAESARAIRTCRVMASTGCPSSLGVSIRAEPNLNSGGIRGKRCELFAALRNCVALPDVDRLRSFASATELNAAGAFIPFGPIGPRRDQRTCDQDEALFRNNFRCFRAKRQTSVIGIGSGHYSCRKVDMSQ